MLCQSSTISVSTLGAMTTAGMSAHVWMFFQQDPAIDCGSKIAAACCAVLSESPLPECCQILQNIADGCMKWYYGIVTINFINHKIMNMDRECLNFKCYSVHKRCFGLITMQHVKKSFNKGHSLFNGSFYVNGSSI